MRFALGLFIAGGFFLSSFDAVGKLLMSETSLLVILWARYLGQFLFSIGIAFWKIGPLFLKTEHPQIQLLRSFLLLVTSFLFFGGLQFLPLAETSAIAFTTPLWVALLSGPLVGERVQRSDWWVAAIGFSGILLIARPGTEIFHYGAVLVAVMALLNAVYQLLTRRLIGDSPFTTFFYSGLLGTFTLTSCIAVFLSCQTYQLFFFCAR
jgi:drug/metabolite transporter (DMT)-like permease